MPQCPDTYEVWRCVFDADHPSVHESYAVSGAFLYWTHDHSIALCVQRKNPQRGLPREMVT